MNEDRERTGRLLCCLEDAAALLSLATASEFPLRHASSAGLTLDDNLQNARIFMTGETRTEIRKFEEREGRIDTCGVSKTCISPGPS